MAMTIFVWIIIYCVIGLFMEWLEGDEHNFDY